MTEWVAVVFEEGDEPIEIPTESDGTMFLTSVTAQFPGAIGLKFRNTSTGNWRGVRCLDNVLYPPSEDGWGSVTYICTRQSLGQSQVKKEEAALKRKSENDTDGMSSKTQRVDGEDDADTSTCDLIILGLSWKATERDIRDYFEKYGEVMMVQVKMKDSGQSRGFAFIRFKDFDVQNKVLLTRHMIMERWCDVKVPDSQEIKVSRAAASTKIFVARITENITESDLREHFEKFGSVTDIYIPKPFRSFAFVTFCEARVAESLFGKDHIINGVSVHIGSAQPKARQAGGYERSGREGGGGGGGGGGGRNNFDSGYGHHGGFGSGGSYQNPWSSGGPNGGGGGYSRGPHRGGPFYM